MGMGQAERNPGAVEAAIESLAKSVVTLGDEIGSLAAKLSPVLVSIPPTPIGAETAGEIPEDQSQIVMSITETRDKIQALYCRTQELNERCQL